MKRKKSHRTQEIEIPISGLSLEQFGEIIDSGCLEGEVPFELLADHYPRLLSKWYPGYPGEPRLPRDDDPFTARAHVKNGMMSLEIPGMENRPLPAKEFPDGTFDVLMKKMANGEWFVHGTKIEPDKDCLE